MLSGRAEIDDRNFRISGPRNVLIPFTEIGEPELFRLHGTGRMIRFSWRNSTIFVTVVRLNILGLFAIINFFRTGRLFERLRSRKQTA